MNAKDANSIKMCIYVCLSGTEGCTAPYVAGWLEKKRENVNILRMNLYRQMKLKTSLKRFQGGI